MTEQRIYSRAELVERLDLGRYIGIAQYAAIRVAREAAAMLLGDERALKKIAEGRGRYSRDPLTHADNTIEDMKAVASAALAGEYPEPEGAP